jgi:CRP/FNR family transcriptional regulator
MGDSIYPANAVTTEACRLILVPARDFHQMVDIDADLRAFVFKLLSQRLTEMMTLVNEVTFGRLDERLLDYLVEKSADGVLSATHQKIANDLGTSREVVSRLLKDFERSGRVGLARNEIRLLDEF